MSKERAEVVKIGETLLGPIVYDFCSRLNLLCTKQSETKKTRVLYQARAGIRIFELIQLYRQVSQSEPLVNEDILYISRLAVIKGCLAHDVGYIADLYVGQYRGYTVGQFLTTIDDSFSGLCPKKFSGKAITTADFIRLYFSEEALGAALRLYFLEQSQLFTCYIKQMLKDADSALLVDTGWYGTTQMLLMRYFPEVSWVGLYFGKWHYNKGTPEHYDKMQGLCIDDTVHSRLNPKRWLLCYNHLFEGLFEPNKPSTIGYCQVGEKIAPIFEKNRSSSKQFDDDLYLGVRNYFIAVQSGDTEFDRSFKYRYWRAARYILFPSVDCVSRLSVGPRQANMGKNVSVEIVLPPAENHTMSFRQRYKKALWKPGQLALECKSYFRLVCQAIYFLRLILIKN